MKIREVASDTEWGLMEKLYTEAFPDNERKPFEMIREKHREKRFFLEVESLAAPADNREERRRRKQFYLNNGMRELGVYARLFGVEFELLGYDCEVSFREYFSLYDDIYGSYASNFLEEL